MNMMLVPKKNDFDLFDNFFGRDDFFSNKKTDLMKTEIKETPDKYIIEMDLPGFDKENINILLNDGYIEISAKQESENNLDENTKYVRKERFYGECSRSFYVGEDITEEDIDAEFKNGILIVNVPKKTEPEIKEKKQIEIK